MTQPAMIVRRDAAQATLDKFGGVAFGYGHHDCAQMVAFHLRKLGYRPKLTKAGRYSAALGATKALKRLGHETLAAAMDAHGFERIPPAATLVGDVMEMEGVDGPGALVVVLGNGRVLGYHEEAFGAAVLQPNEMMTAWRVPPRG